MSTQNQDIDVLFDRAIRKKVTPVITRGIVNIWTVDHSHVPSIIAQLGRSINRVRFTFAS
jgi:hypothetical protein